MNKHREKNEKNTLFGKKKYPLNYKIGLEYISLGFMVIVIFGINYANLQFT